MHLECCKYNATNDSANNYNTNRATNDSCQQLHKSMGHHILLHSLSHYANTLLWGHGSGLRDF